MSETHRPAFSPAVEQELFEVRGEAFVRSVNESALETDLTRIEDEAKRRRALRCLRIARAHEAFLARMRA